MERGSNKHGPRQDEQLIHETEGLVRSGHSTHAQEWKDTEPTTSPEYDDPREGGTPIGISPKEVQLRAELTTTLTSDQFPVDRESLLQVLRDRDASAELLRLVDDRAGDKTYDDITALLHDLSLVEAR